MLAIINYSFRPQTRIQHGELIKNCLKYGLYERRAVCKLWNAGMLECETLECWNFGMHNNVKYLKAFWQHHHHHHNHHHHHHHHHHHDHHHHYHMNYEHYYHQQINKSITHSTDQLICFIIFAFKFHPPCSSTHSKLSSMKVTRTSMPLAKQRVSQDRSYDGSKPINHSLLKHEKTVPHLPL